MKTIRVASRRSQLALTQTQWVIQQLQTRRPDLTFEIVPVVTKGDKILDVALSKVGGKGLFVSEVEQALLRGEADFAVHSLKDVPAELAKGLVLAGIPKREDPRDALISKSGQGLMDLPQGAVVGTSSLRRVAQLLRARPDLVIQPLRGNIDTRLGKLNTDGLDAIVLAAAGLHRMGWHDRITEYLPVDLCLPAIGQGILGVECRENDDFMVELLHEISDEPTKRASVAERTLLFALNGGCQIPIGGYAQGCEDGQVHLRGMVATPDGSQILYADVKGSKPEALGHQAAELLKEQGADAILENAVATS
jgi:hydroxymethylbilane synthase